MERMLPKMYKDLLGIVSVLCMVLFPHQVVAEESLCHRDFRPQPYSLEEEVGSLVWEYPKVPLQWKVDLNETNVWKEFMHQKPKGIPRSQPALYLPQVPWNFSKKEKPEHQQYQQVRGIQNPGITPSASGIGPCDSSHPSWWWRKFYASSGKEQSRAEARKEDSPERRKDCQEGREKKPASKASRTG